jgi:hypothetical protein
MHRLGRLIRNPFCGLVDITPGIWKQQMHVRRIHRRGGDDKTVPRFRDADAQRIDNRRRHAAIEDDRRMRLSFERHPLTRRVTGMKFMRLEKANLFVPRFGPRTPVIPRQPQPVTAFDKVIGNGSGHVLPL